MPTVKTKIERAIQQIDKNRCDSARNTLEGLIGRMSKGDDVPRRPPNQYAEYVRENYNRIKDENPGVSSSEIMALLAKEWKSRTKESESESDAVQPPPTPSPAAPKRKTSPPKA